MDITSKEQTITRVKRLNGGWKTLRRKRLTRKNR